MLKIDYIVVKCSFALVETDGLCKIIYKLPKLGLGIPKN